MNKKTVIVIGAGIGGLSAAALLAKEGYKVTVIEKNETYGGRAMVFQEKGYTFDMGPSWYLMPEIFEQFFELFGKKTSEYYKLVKLDPGYRIFFSQKEYIDITPDLEKNIQTFEKIEKGSGTKLRQYLKASEYKYKISIKEFIFKEYRSILDFVKLKYIKELNRLGLTSSISSYVNKFFKSDKLRRIMQYSIVFLGGSPQNTSAIYSLISHLDFNQGVYYPIGGIGQLTKAMYELCLELAVEFKFSTSASSIRVDNKIAKSVLTNNKEYFADQIIVNADYQFAETKLLEEKYQTFAKDYWSKKVLAPSAFIIYLGLKRKIPNISHHNLIFENDWIEHFKDIFVNMKFPEKPSYYICAPSTSDDTVAPKGSENLFILVPIPSGISDTEELRKIHRGKIFADLRKYLGDNFEDDIEVEKIISLNDYSHLYNAYKGSALGLSHTMFQSTLWRPSHRSKKVTNLYYTGQYTNPGIGMAMCTISSQIAVNEMKKHV